MTTTGIYRLAAAVPQVKIANCRENAKAIEALFDRASKSGAAITLFPELSLTGASCGNLFLMSDLLDEAQKAASLLAKATADRPGVLIFGMPLEVNNNIYSAAVVAQGGRLRGAVLGKCVNEAFPQLATAENFVNDYLTIGDETIPVGCDLLFADEAGASFAIDIGSDLFSALPEAPLYAFAGAKIICAPAALPGCAGKNDKNFKSLTALAERINSAIIFANSGVTESAVDQLFAALAAISGGVEDHAVSDASFDDKEKLIFLDADLDKIDGARRINSEFRQSVEWDLSIVELDTLPQTSDFTYAKIDPRPYLDGNRGEAAVNFCREVFAMQSTALATRMRTIGAEKLVVGISGGLDSALTLLVCAEACRKLGKAAADTIAVTMPGFGTSSRTRGNAETLCEALGVSFREVGIAKSALQHFADIGHDPEKIDSVYENAQARERTQILMDIANGCRGIVVGTGDLSEAALGWCTFNGDHMSMYSVNASIPKSLIADILRSVTSEKSAARKTLESIIDTPVSPELKPLTDSGEIAQKTEDALGPYLLHDFFIYNFCRYGLRKEKLLLLAEAAFKEQFSVETIRKTWQTFIERFIRQQFKRNCVPDGIGCLDVSLSPRTSWRMPSEADPEIWH